MKKKQFLSLILGGLMVFSINSPALASNNAQLYKNYIEGYNGYVKADNNISKGEAAAIISRSIFSGDLENAKESSIYDVSGKWYSKSINLLMEKGLVDTDAQGSFNPENFISKDDFIDIIMKIDLDNNGERDFQNLKETLDSEDYGNGGSFTRGDAIRIINKVLGIDSKNSTNISNGFKDLDKSHKAYNDILLATSTFIAKDGKVGKILSPGTIEFEGAKYLEPKLSAMSKLNISTYPSSIMGFDWVNSVNLIASSANIIGVPDNHHIPEEFHGKYPEIVSEDGIVDYELIKSSKPSLFIASKATLEKDEKLKKVLEENNTSTFAPKNFDSPEEVLKFVGLLSSTTGDYDKALENQVQLLSKIEKLKERNSSNPKIALIIFEKNEGSDAIIASVPAKDTYSAELLKMGNFVNIGDSLSGPTNTKDSKNFGYINVSVEEIMNSNPDALVIMPRTARENRSADYDAFVKNIIEKYPDSKVVKEEKIGRIDHHWVLPKSVQFIDAIEAISEINEKVLEEKIDVSKGLKDGVYTGVASGYQSGLTTEVTVKDGKIESIKVTSHKETPSIYSTAEEKIIKGIIDSQSTSVDTVSGATMSSQGIMNSVNNALQNAK